MPIKTLCSFFLFAALFCFPQKAFACEGLKINISANDGILIDEARMVSGDGFGEVIDLTERGNRFSVCMLSNQVSQIVSDWRLEITGSENYFQVFDLQILKPTAKLKTITPRFPHEITVQVYDPTLQRGFEQDVIRTHSFQYRNSTKRWANFHYCKLAYQRAKRAKNANAQYHAGMCWYYASKQIVEQSGGIVKVDAELVDEFESEFKSNFIDKTGSNSALRRAYYNADKKLQLRVSDILYDIRVLEMRGWMFYRFGAAYSDVDTKPLNCSYLKHFENMRDTLLNSGETVQIEIFKAKYENLYKVNKKKNFNYARNTLGLDMELPSCGL